MPPDASIEPSVDSSTDEAKRDGGKSKMTSAWAKHGFRSQVRGSVLAKVVVAGNVVVCA